MTFIKGHKLSPGRQKGTPNKATQEARELLETNRMPLIQRALDLALVDNLEKTNVHILSKLLDKLIPTLQAIEHAGNVVIDRPDFSKITKEQLIKIAEMEN
jgi:hypothetical protein